MSIEDQIVALEARIQQCILLASGCTERAEYAATRAEEAAARAELASVQSTQAAGNAQVAEIVAVQAAEIAVIEEEQIEEVAEEIEDASEILPEPGRSRASGNEAESDGLLDGTGETEESTQPEVQPIVITVKQHHAQQPELFKRNHTRFHRGRTR